MQQLAGGRRTHELGSTYWFYKILTFFSILTFKHISLKVFFGEVGVGVKFRNLFLLSWWLRDLLIRRDVFGLFGFLVFLLEKNLFDGYALEKIDWAKILRVYMIFCAVNYFPTTRRSINKQLTWASGPLGVRTDTRSLYTLSVESSRFIGYLKICSLTQVRCLWRTMRGVMTVLIRQFIDNKHSSFFSSVSLKFKIDLLTKVITLLSADQLIYPDYRQDVSVVQPFVCRPSMFLIFV